MSMSNSERKILDVADDIIDRKNKMNVMKINF